MTLSTYINKTIYQVRLSSEKEDYPGIKVKTQKLKITLLMKHACIIVASSQASLSITTLQQKPITKSRGKHGFLKQHGKITAS